MWKSNYNFISWKKLIKILSKFFDVKIIWQKWSHIKIKVNNRKTIIPNHKELAYGTYKWILEQLDIDEEIINK